mgnify:CR=1 FL=1
MLAKATSFYYLILNMNTCISTRGISWFALPWLCTFRNLEQTWYASNLQAKRTLWSVAQLQLILLIPQERYPTNIILYIQNLVKSPCCGHLKVGLVILMVKWLWNSGWCQMKVLKQRKTKKKKATRMNLELLSTSLIFKAYTSFHSSVRKYVWFWFPQL